LAEWEERVPLGINGFAINEGDRVKVTSPRLENLGVPLGAITSILKVIYVNGEHRYQLVGYDEFCLELSEIELIAYIRQRSA
jgi:hypothetical protein